MITKEELDKIRGVHIDSPDCECSDCAWEYERLARLSKESYAPDYKWVDSDGYWHSIDGDMLRGDF